MKRLIFSAVFAAPVFFAGTASALTIIPPDTLLTNGDFQAGSQPLNRDFNSAAGPYNNWLGNPGKVSVNSFGENLYADFSLPADPADSPFKLRLIQGIDLKPGSIPSGTPMEIGFDFLLSSSASKVNESPSALYVLGLHDSDKPIKADPSVGEGFPSGDILFSKDLPSSTQSRGQWVSTGGIFSTNQEYDSIAVVFNAETVGSSADLEGVDNVFLSKRRVQVPEPGTILLIGTALIAIRTAKKKFQQNPAV